MEEQKETQKITQKADWVEIRNDYVLKNYSLSMLEEKYKGITSRSSIAKHMRNEGWVEQKKKHKHKIEEKVTEKVAESISEKKAKATEKHLELTNNLCELVNDLTLKYLEQVQSGKKITAKSVEALANAISKLQMCQRESLNIKNGEEQKDETRPEITVIKGLDISKI